MAKVAVMHSTRREYSFLQEWRFWGDQSRCLRALIHGRLVDRERFCLLSLNDLHPGERRVCGNWSSRVDSRLFPRLKLVKSKASYKNTTSDNGLGISAVARHSENLMREEEEGNSWKDKWENTGGRYVSCACGKILAKWSSEQHRFWKTL